MLLEPACRWSVMLYSLNVIQFVVFAGMLPISFPFSTTEKERLSCEATQK